MTEMTAQKIMIIMGTRPEAIKMMPVIRAIRACDDLVPLVVSTGQHRQMLDQVFAAFGEQADIDLSIMSAGQTLDGITALALAKVSDVIREHAPALVMVHGDTTTAMAAALAAFYAAVPIAHVEAGLRSYDLSRPWPEEFNRVMIDSVSELLFAPTEESAANLKRETARERHILVTGNTGIDALLQMAAQTPGDGRAILGRLGADPDRSLILVTGHRRESFGDGFRNICEGIRRIAMRQDVSVIYPVHLNPNVRGVVGEMLGGFDNIHLIDPVSYTDMVALMKASKIILTDSGGIQEEGPALGKPVIVMRDVTERPEGVAAGAVTLVGTDPDRIAQEVCALLDDEALYRQRARPVFPYGDGNAAARIAQAVSKYFRAGGSGGDGGRA